MDWPCEFSRSAVLFLLGVTLVGCQSSSLPAASFLVVQTIGQSSLSIPGNVQRIAVFYPRSSNPDFLDAYQRLAIITEQRFQVAGAVGDESAVRIGHLLGVDSVLLYSIDGPTLRDRLFAPLTSQLRPIPVTTKIVRVESAEVIYLNVVTVRMDDEGRWDWSSSDNLDYQQLSP